MYLGRNGDDDTEFVQFATTRWSQLVRTAYMLTGDFHEAEDLVQTTLIKVYTQWRRLRRDETDAYVRRALINNNRSRHRKHRVVHLLMPFLPDATEPDEASGSEKRDVLLRALAELPPRQRTVVVLRYWEDLSIEEVAYALGCSEGTVKSQASRALAKLRTHPALAIQSLTSLGDAP
ncbi:SigE family RNA polymerase sigma factor [Streptomyces guryensis]|uniref:SigE family RNA polymerase sigma factor n=1 Tax=Streptomyces guryensis TaxID=2886947 RepID=A0A9Q3Z9D9_9ACTN|nr:SigE family RNA polymerase sigma factor [Streptomyces guryensis]MCD9880226.1 SigE family RNA polymerase sigma factor [Streptomyces guryensis]